MRCYNSSFIANFGFRNFDTTAKEGKIYVNTLCKKVAEFEHNVS